MYRLPLFEIVGVTSAKLMFSVDFFYLEHEREENFKWAPEKIKEFFFSENFLSKVVATVRELALMNVMEVVCSKFNTSVVFVLYF